MSLLYSAIMEEGDFMAYFLKQTIKKGLIYRFMRVIMTRNVKEEHTVLTNLLDIFMSCSRKELMTQSFFIQMKYRNSTKSTD